MLAHQAYQNYQERVRREAQAAQEREAAIQQKIASLRSQVRSRSERSFATATVTPVELASTTPTQARPVQVVTAKTAVVDREVAAQQQRQLEAASQWLPKVRTEYQGLIARGLLEAPVVEAALRQAEQALGSGNLTAAEAQLRGLDDARIEVM